MDFQDKIDQSMRDMQQRIHERQLAENAAHLASIQHAQTMRIETKKLHTQAELKAAVQALQVLQEENKRNTEEQNKSSKRNFLITLILTIISVAASIVAAIASVISACHL